MISICLSDIIFAAPEVASGSENGWRSGLRDLTAVMVYKEPSADPSAPGASPLPEQVLARLGGAVIDYEGFVVARLPAGDAETLAETAWSAGLPRS